MKSWECGYFTEEISRGFEQFYDNIGGVADSFANFWAIMAEEFKDFDSVLGIKGITTKKVSAQPEMIDQNHIY
jgi:hypothetical protein